MQTAPGKVLVDSAGGVCYCRAMTNKTTTKTLYRVWALTYQADDRWVWLPISRPFRAKRRAEEWGNCLNTEWKIEEEEDDE